MGASSVVCGWNNAVIQHRQVNVGIFSQSLSVGYDVVSQCFGEDTLLALAPMLRLFNVSLETYFLKVSYGMPTRLVHIFWLDLGRCSTNGLDLIAQYPKSFLFTTISVNSIPKKRDTAVPFDLEDETKRKKGFNS
jgi:hypothetical protein